MLIQPQTERPRCAYPAKLTAEADDGFTVTFRDVPEAITEGDSRDEALMRAEDALESALAMYIAAKEALPKASAAKRGEVMVPLSARHGQDRAIRSDALRLLSAVAGMASPDQHARMRGDMRHRPLSPVAGRQPISANRLSDQYDRLQ